MKTALIAIGLATASLGAAAAIAHEPVENVSPARHAYIAKAQDLSRQAYDELSAAQAFNADDLGGHAARAKTLLAQANAEMKLAAQAADRN